MSEPGHYAISAAQHNNVCPQNLLGRSVAKCGGAHTRSRVKNAAPSLSHYNCSYAPRQVFDHMLILPSKAGKTGHAAPGNTRLVVKLKQYVAQALPTCSPAAQQPTARAQIPLRRCYLQKLPHLEIAGHPYCRAGTVLERIRSTYSILFRS